MEIQAIWEIAEMLSSILVAANYNNTFKHLTIAMHCCIHFMTLGWMKGSFISATSHPAAAEPQSLR